MTSETNDLDSLIDTFVIVFIKWITGDEDILENNGFLYHVGNHCKNPLFNWNSLFIT